MSGTPERGDVRVGRPRSEQAREAVLRAVDDLLVEVGYAAMTMKGIAARAGVSRQTVYRWWATKAEILFEASVADAADELAVDRTGDRVRDLEAYIDALVKFLSRSPAGSAYRALLGESQHDPAVAQLLASADPLGQSARLVIEPLSDPMPVELAGALLVGPVLFWVMSGKDPAALDARELAAAFARDVGARGWLAGPSASRLAPGRDEAKTVS